MAWLPKNTPANEGWRARLEDRAYALNRIDQDEMLSDWDEQVDAWETLHGDKVAEVQRLENDLATEQSRQPEWGICRRGCPPAFLNQDGFCSPACVLGAPRGKFVTEASITDRYRQINIHAGEYLG
jgi:hypothetical protein